MPTLECDHETVDGVTLVECRLASEATQRVTVEPTHDGPIWPPRRQGVPAPGWHDDGWTGVVPSDGVRALGYATPAEPAAEPVRVTATDPPTDDSSVTARDVVRSLGDPTPTRDAVPPADTDASATPSSAPTGPSPSPTRTGGGDTHPDAERDGDPDPVAAEDAALPDERRESTPSSSPRLDAIETRQWTARDLAAVSTVGEASAAVDRAGGMAAVRALDAQLAADREHLQALADRTSRLLAETEAVDVPVDALERLV